MAEPQLSRESPLRMKPVPPGVAMAALATVYPGLIRGAARMQQTQTYGVAIGLTPDEVGDVIRVWRDAAVKTPWRVPWDVVDESMVRRAMGLPWGPEERARRVFLAASTLTRTGDGDIVVGAASPWERVGS